MNAYSDLLRLCRCTRTLVSMAARDGGVKRCWFHGPYWLVRALFCLNTDSSCVKAVVRLWKTMRDAEYFRKKEYPTMESRSLCRVLRQVTSLTESLTDSYSAANICVCGTRRSPHEQRWSHERLVTRPIISMNVGHQKPRVQWRSTERTLVGQIRHCLAGSLPDKIPNSTLNFRDSGYSWQSGLERLGGDQSLFRASRSSTESQRYSLAEAGFEMP